jgi:hypothetical protein
MAKTIRAKRVSPPPPYIDRGEPLPRSYVENRIVALVRSPGQVYLYWDVETEVRLAGNPVVVRVHDLTVRGAYDFEPPADADNWYLAVAPNRAYRFELFERGGGLFRRLAGSEEVTTPVRWAGESGEYVPAEIIQAVRYPISRKAAARGARATPEGYPAEVAAQPARRTERSAAAPEAAEAAPPDRPAGPPPTPIPVPWEKTFAAAYAGGH